MKQLRILLADDHALVRQGLRQMLEAHPDWTVIAEVGNGVDAVKQAEELKPDVAVLDVAMPALNGIEATMQIARRSPATKILLLTMHAEEPYISQALKAGATGYLLKDSADISLIEAVGAVSKGKPFLGP
jgi:DNA-binding NarL/FixJ family response regulator